MRKAIKSIKTETQFKNVRVVHKGLCRNEILAFRCRLCDVKMIKKCNFLLTNLIFYKTLTLKPIVSGLSGY